MNNAKHLDMDESAAGDAWHVESQAYDHGHGQAQVHDAVFGEITETGPNYRNVGWIATTVVLVKTSIGLGVLGLPAALNTLGMVPGAICLCIVATINTWSAYMIGAFKKKHPTVYGVDDACGIMFGRVVREAFGILFCIYWIFVSGSGIIALSTSFNAMSTHGACTAVFVACSAILGFLLASIRTIGRISSVAWIGLVSILASLITVTVAVGVQDRPASAPQVGPWASDYKLFNNPSFREATAAVSTIVFAYAGTPAFFGIAHEMRDQRFYTRSMLICQIIMTAVYISLSVVIYYYCGSYVASPALGSAGEIMKKVCYGIGFPGLTASLTLVSHFPAKFVFIRILRNSRHLTSNSAVHWGTWLSCTFGVLLIAYIIASGIPGFGGLVSLVGALFGTLLSIQPMGCMWLYDNWRKGKAKRTWRWVLMVGWNVFVILAGTFLTVSGTYGSIVNIIHAHQGSEGKKAFTCADNSNSV